MSLLDDYMVDPRMLGRSFYTRTASMELDIDHVVIMKRCFCISHGYPWVP